eukprot:jgi/Bigna1/130863/aug1.12_g5571
MGPRILKHNHEYNAPGAEVHIQPIRLYKSRSPGRGEGGTCGSRAQQKRPRNFDEEEELAKRRKSVSDIAEIPAAAAAAVTPSRSKEAAPSLEIKGAGVEGERAAPPPAPLGSGNLASKGSGNDKPVRDTDDDKKHPRSTVTSRGSDRGRVAGEVLCFIGHIPATPGTFDVERAKEIGIPQGPVYGQLKRGKAVECTLKDGTTRVVEPHEVVAPGYPKTRFAIIDCPTPLYIDSLVSKTVQEARGGGREGAAETTKAGQGLDGKKERGGGGGADEGSGKIVCVVHLAPRSVLGEARYLHWAARFAPQAKHIAVHSSCCGQQTVWRASEVNVMKLRMPASPPLRSQQQQQEEEQQVRLPGLYTEGRHLGRFWLYPGKKLGLDHSLVPGPPGEEDVKLSYEKNGASSATSGAN